MALTPRADADVDFFGIDVSKCSLFCSVPVAGAVFTSCVRVIVSKCAPPVSPSARRQMD